jgi:hypothetical protein
LRRASVAQSSNEPQAYGKIIAGLNCAEAEGRQGSGQQITAANTLLDTWIGRFELGRAYLEAGSFKEADRRVRSVCEAAWRSHRTIYG